MTSIATAATTAATNMETSATTTTATEVDEQLYSRQLYVMGHEAQRRMMSSTCLLVGTNGLGVEIAKNVILAGLSKLIVCDPLPPNYYDLGAHFYLNESHVTNAGSGISRAAICRDALSQLNPHVNVHLLDTVTALTAEQLVPQITAGISVVVVTIPLPEPVLEAINAQCRAVQACFIYACTASVFGQVFCDFGNAFVVMDTDGEPPATSQIESILTDVVPPTVKVLEDQGRHGLETGSVVRFARLQGVEGLQNNVDYTVTVTGPYTFSIDNVDLTPYPMSTMQQGYITAVKQPVVLSFAPYATKKLETEGMTMSDFSKFDRPPVLHAAFRALLQYMVENNGNLPEPHDRAAAQRILQLAQQLNAEAFANNNTAAENIVLHVATGSRSALSPMCAAIGGMVGQEVLKACSGKFTPLSGFFYLDASETLPETPLYQAPQNSRYDSQIVIFGADMQEKLCAQRYFMVGAGAIGCEMLKNWALMGVGCSEQGKVYVTDMDRIEKSNLSRQFLFRNTDIDQFKSATAAKAATVMNPTLNVTAFQEKVAPDTEHLFGDDFYDQLTGVCTALDNVEARLYVDQRCLFYRLPMLESGTLGTKGNTQVVVPHVTEHYGATRDPPEKSIPVCTLKNFPNQIEHTLQWARDWFEGAFKQAPEEVNTYLSSESVNAYLERLHPNTRRETLQLVQRTLVEERPSSYVDCLTWARLTFEQLFHNQIAQLLYNFPPDQVTASGQKFWSGSKRCPKPLHFDPAALDEEAAMRNHYAFCVTAANLRAHMFGLQVPSDLTETDILQLLSDVIVPDFAPAEGVKIAANDAEANEQDDDAAAAGNQEQLDQATLLASLPKPGECAGLRLHVTDFDKDVDEHNTFVTACSNCRASNYGIPTADAHRSRAIAGRIIPAIATTTALVTGLVCLELYKLIGTHRQGTALPISAYKNGFVNLAIPFMTMSEPNPPAKTKAKLKGREWEWTAWDSLDVNLGNVTMGEFMEYFQKEYNLEISMLSHGVSILYSFFANAKKVQERKAMRMTEVITSITKKEFPPNQLFIILEVIANDCDTDEEVELPYVKFRFR